MEPKDLAFPSCAIAFASAAPRVPYCQLVFRLREARGAFASVDCSRL